jgi:hypothetical protein
MNLEENRQD